MINVRFDTTDPVQRVEVHFNDGDIDCFDVDEDGTELITTDTSPELAKVVVYDTEGNQQQYLYPYPTKVHLTYAPEEEDEKTPVVGYSDELAHFTNRY